MPSGIRSASMPDAIMFTLPTTTCSICSAKLRTPFVGAERSPAAGIESTMASTLARMRSKSATYFSFGDWASAADCAANMSSSALHAARQFRDEKRVIDHLCW